MIVVHSLTITGTRNEPQLPHRMSGHTTRIASKILTVGNIKNKKKQSTQLYLAIFVLLGWLRIAANDLFSPSEVTYETAPSDTHRYKNPGAFSHEMAGHTIRFASKNECQKYFQKKSTQFYRHFF